MKVKSFYEPVLQTSVLFMTETTPKDIEAWLKRNRNAVTVDGYDTLAGSVTLIDETDKKGRKTREYLIIVEDKKDFYTLLHEVVHLVGHILTDHLIPTTQDNSEMFAYYQTYWFKKLWRFMSNKEVVLKRT